MYLKRKIDMYLSDWKNNSERKPLIVKGPRQIGKTESIRKFAGENYKSIIEINFVISEKYKQITSDGYSAKAIIKNISLIDPSHKFIPGETLIFLTKYRNIMKLPHHLNSFTLTEDLRANKNLSVYKGALYESIVGEALVKSGYGLYYYKRENSTLEEDFFVRTADRLIPIEVKARNSKAKSLIRLISSDRYSDISCGIKFCAGNIGFSNDIYTFPYYCAFLLKRYLKEMKF